MARIIDFAGNLNTTRYSPTYEERLLTFTSSLPDIKTLDHYKKHDPEFYKILVEEISASGAHYRDMEERAIRARSRGSLLGIIIGGVIGMIALTCAFLAGLHGNQLVAVAIMGVFDILYLTAYFVAMRAEPRV